MVTHKYYYEDVQFISDYDWRIYVMFNRKFRGSLNILTAKNLGKV